METRQELLGRIDHALAKMKANGFENHAKYRELKEKRDLVAAGTKYQVRDVTEDLIRGFGAQMASISRLYRMRR